MYKMLNGFKNEISELKSDYLAGQDKEIDVREIASLVYSNQLKFLMISYFRINKKLQQNSYLNQDRHHHHYQYDFHHKKLLLKE